MSEEKEKGKVINLPPTYVGMLDWRLTVIRTEATSSPIYKAVLKDMMEMAEKADYLVAFQK
jgi:hypothetical protein|tara:strand:+ start:702 stop:884 length:183 start_codon:yes stop_codon:yes gene_type:complete